MKVDFFSPENLMTDKPISLLLINDGQDMEKLGLTSILEKLYAEHSMQPIICAGIHAGVDRKMEYGIASQRDYLGRGAKAEAFTSFVLKELLPIIYHKYSFIRFSEKAFAGFSLGGLMAMDIVWNHPNEFKKVGVFSGSFWWRSVDQHHKEYNDDRHRIMQQQIRHDEFKPGLKFFFQCGNKDETRDRNENGIIDSVDDTLDIIKELVTKGYDPSHDIFYMEMKDGHHDIPTWGRAMPEFLKWSWPNK
jgi:enterochelin esterase-like enzyme